MAITEDLVRTGIILRGKDKGLTITAQYLEDGNCVMVKSLNEEGDDRHLIYLGIEDFLHLFKSTTWIFELGTWENPITHGIKDNFSRAGKFHKCGRCKVIAKATPSRDFFGSENQPVTCKSCSGPYRQNNLPLEAPK